MTGVLSYLASTECSPPVLDIYYMTLVSQVHLYSSAIELTLSGAQCCETETIGPIDSCCNGVGYNPALQVCADVGEGKSGCGSGTVCPIGEWSGGSHP